VVAFSTTTYPLTSCVSVTKGAKSSQMADFYICPPVEQYSLLELHQFDEIVEIGYRFASAKMAEWQDDGRLEGVKSRSRTS
jgi:predicted acylesterase/phospholipase RssA